MKAFQASLHPSVVRDIQQLAAGSRDGLETGGILFGRGPDDAGVVFVESAGDAGPNAIREAGFFMRDLKHAQRLSLDAWALNKSVWVGEWHTHPHGDPMPSAVDLVTYAKLLATDGLQFEIFVSIIVIAGDGGDWSDPELWPWLLELSSEQKPTLTDRTIEK